MRSQLFRAAVNLFAEARLVFVQTPAHIYVLGSLAREHEHNWAVTAFLLTNEYSLALATF